MEPEEVEQYEIIEIGSLLSTKMTTVYHSKEYILVGKQY